MTGPVRLIATREFRTYVATWSFWVALVVGPLMMGGMVALGAVLQRPAAPTSVRVLADDPDLARLAAGAVAEAAGLDGEPVTMAPPGAGTVDARLIVEDGPGGLRLRLEGPARLSPLARTLIVRTLERDLARRGLSTSGPPARIEWREERGAGGGGGAAGAISRFAVVIVFWLTLTGALGMLLQAVVRERANRALETLLAAARPWEIVTGKVVGVGAVSMLLLAVWVGSAATLALVAPATDGLAILLLRDFSDPFAVGRAAILYLLGFAFYGYLTVAVGAAARDSAAAQNLARPMFAILLAGFFAAMVGAQGGGQIAWLAYLPPFTPFMLLAAPGIGAMEQGVALLLLAVATVGAARLAIGRLAGVEGGRVLRLPSVRPGSARL